MMAETGDGSSKTIRFRNYQPNDKTLANKVVKTNVSTFDSTMQQTASKNELDLLRNELSILNEEIGGAGSINIMPKKANWDLKNTIEHKLEKVYYTFPF